jgi:hypothetical protein
MRATFQDTGISPPDNTDATGGSAKGTVLCCLSDNGWIRCHGDRIIAHSDLLVRGHPGDIHGGGPDDPRLEPRLDLQSEGGGARPGATRGSVYTQATMASVTRQGLAIPSNH